MPVLNEFEANFLFDFSEDGTEWIPKESARICSAHFVDNKAVNHPNHPSYLPTIHPIVAKRNPPSEANLSRFRRYVCRKVVWMTNERNDAWAKRKRG